MDIKEVVKTAILRNSHEWGDEQAEAVLKAINEAGFLVVPAKAQSVPEVINIGNELQSWVAVHSFAAKDGNDIVCAVDANALAEEIEKLTGANA